jgi:hypothetical protein
MKASRLKEGWAEQVAPIKKHDSQPQLSVLPFLPELSFLIFLTQS